MYTRQELDASVLHDTVSQFRAEFPTDVVQGKLRILLHEPVHIVHILRRVHCTGTIDEGSARFYIILRTA